ncbi:hypothetical protein Pmani_003866 [Petrolisthes manimaculis]|uniref:Uncharacterized protein n=1 Tax=Petrolisthes manimaculis TaxID=1843537 RepID=A0AAE1UKY7_9EUCA|nr:hypothetical protein Pmani_009599 [Petrolisthes manimaculis]KAK4321339.1 hypothetical protein Pmani_007820 [Petrolisthes manimaculis]KAK4321340.1 hypothetical protein Pmani_007821 [Petrolisthes manimaculis]KAK4322670.1 hypothetical protein Pmani_006571 [Petrolisthes manimaculis]KAK4325518.1 hypothetical protein Pmani_003866 [Petrolisthes manimaculis]
MIVFVSWLCFGVGSVLWRVVVLKLAQLACLKLGLGMDGIWIGEAEMVKMIGMWSLVVRGPGAVCVL